MLKYAGSLIVYHVTPESNLSSIHMHGISPVYSRGKIQASWFVSKRHLEWAILHVCQRHQLYPELVSVCTCCVSSSELTLFMVSGKYFSKSVIFPEHTQSSLSFMDWTGEDYEQK